MKTLTKPRGYGACPSHFFYACMTASTGGAQGYFQAGRHLAMHVATLDPHDIEEQEWDRHLEELAIHIDKTEDRAVLAWLERYAPRCLSLIPRRRHRSFLEGIYSYANEEEHDITER